jgi:hypothetical protein
MTGRQKQKEKFHLISSRVVFGPKETTILASRLPNCTSSSRYLLVVRKVGFLQVDKVNVSDQRGMYAWSMRTFTFTPFMCFALPKSKGMLKCALLTSDDDYISIDDIVQSLLLDAAGL